MSTEPTPTAATAVEAPTTRVPWWLWPNILSLDAPLVAVLCQMALARACKVAVMPAVHWALFLTVWLIYVVDRVLDGFSLRHAAKVSARHAFYRRHRWLFTLLVIPVIGAGLLWLGLNEVPAGIFWRGVGLGFLVGLYLLHYAARGHRPMYIFGNVLACLVGALMLYVVPVPMVFKALYGAVLLALLGVAIAGDLNKGFRLLPKEAVCGYLFAIGSSLGVHFFSGDQQFHPFTPEVLMLAVLFTLNCIAVSCFERQAETQPDPNGIMQTWPQVARVYPLLIVMLAGMTCWTLSKEMPMSLFAFSMAVLVSTLLLGVVHLMARRLKPELSHVLADAAIALPVLVVALAL